MACTPLPTPPPLPPLPGGISLSPTIPTPSFDPSLCCKLIAFPTVPPLPPLPPGIWNAGVAAALGAILAAIETYLDAQPFNCPKE